jgi:hypothetical protein
MYWFGSVGCVGSWFFSSLTSNVRKSFDVIVDELAALLVLVVEVVGVVASFGVACTARREDSAEATVLAADVPDVAIELSCDKSIVRSPQFKISFHTSGSCSHAQPTPAVCIRSNRQRTIRINSRQAAIRHRLVRVIQRRFSEALMLLFSLIASLWRLSSSTACA